MRTVRQGLVFIFIIYISIVYVIGCANFHNVKFLNTACIIPFHGYNYKTCHPMRVSIDNVIFTIPRNFKTDLASIPRFLWPIFAPQYSGFVAPAILHDYLYCAHIPVDRKFADEVLYSALIASNVTAFTAYKFYMGVRLFGVTHFNHKGC